MAEGSTFLRVKNAYDLPTCQKRIRHLRSVAVRNLLCKSYKGKDILKLETYFTLHEHERSPAFHTSEKIKGTVNPTWQSFDMSRHEDNIDTTKSYIYLYDKLSQIANHDHYLFIFASLILRIWTGHNDSFKVVIKIDLNVKGLVFFTEKLQHGGIKFPPNSVIFGMFDKYFIGCDDTALMKKTGSPSPESRSLKVPIQLQVDDSALRTSYTTSALNRIQTVLRAIKQTQAQVRRKQDAIEEHWQDHQERTQKLTERERLVMRVGQLRDEMTWQSSRCQSEKDQLEKVQSEIQKKREMLRERQTSLMKDWMSYKDSKQNHVQTREKILKANAQLRMRQKQLIGELSQYIYPIKQAGKDFFITNVKLPNADQYQGHDDTMLATSLGYACHFVSMMGQFLDIPLRFPMEHRSSRSQIYDLIHSKLAEKDRRFFLYPKGSKERFRFDYGVFLLNANICQLRLFCGLATPKPTDTLPNIKSMLELRLGVKMDSSGSSAVTSPSSGPASGAGSQPDSTRSQAGSSSLSSIVRKEQSLVEADLELPASTQPLADATEASHPAKTGKVEELETLFEGTDDTFFKIRRQSPIFVMEGESSSEPDDQQRSDAALSQSSREPTPSRQMAKETADMQVDYSYDSNHLDRDGGVSPFPGSSEPFSASLQEWVEAEAVLTAKDQQASELAGGCAVPDRTEASWRRPPGPSGSLSVNGDPHIPDASVS